MVRLESYALNVALLIACAISAMAGPATKSPPGPRAGTPIVVDTTFSAVFSPGVPAVTYDPVTIPESGRVRVVVMRDGEATLAVAGLEAGRSFGAHLNTNECGPSGSDAGPRYQHTVDPAATAERPSANPAYANPENEVWLNFTTDGNGLASSAAVHPWPFDPHRPPRSLVLHDGTATGHLACVNVPWS